MLSLLFEADAPKQFFVVVVVVVACKGGFYGLYNFGL